MKLLLISTLTATFEGVQGFIGLQPTTSQTSAARTSQTALEFRTIDFG